MGMDYESVLYELQPILQAHTVEQIPLDGDARARYLAALDGVAVCLRSEYNRSIAGSSGLLKRLLEVLDQTLAKCFRENGVDAFWWTFASDMVRCVANCVVDNDENRHTVAEDKEVMSYVGPICELNGSEHAELQMRAVAMAKNMCLESKSYCERFAPGIKAPLLGLLRRGVDDTLQLIGSGLLLDLFEVDVRASLEDLQFFAEVILAASSTVVDQGSAEQATSEDADLEDVSLEIVGNFSQCFELVVVSEETAVDYSDDEVPNIQSELLQALDELFPKQFADKLIHMRRLMSCVGHVSAHAANSNKRERELCYDVIRESHNGYKIGATLVVLSNSVNSSTDAADVMQAVSFDQLIGAGFYLKDPMQIQGFLDIFRKLLNVSNAMELTPQAIKDLSLILKTCSDQSTFFKDISPLLDNLLKKLLTVLPSSILHDAITSDHCPLLETITGRDSIMSCLALDKLLICRKETPQDKMHLLWESALKFQDQVASGGEGHISLFYLFQLAKTFGIYLKDLDTGKQPLPDFYKAPLIQLLKFISPLQDKNDQASQSAVNNGKFVATMIVRLVPASAETGNSEEDKLLLQHARAFF
ncbi:BEM4 (YPL161C) [Zygosaccharomyces parabailii]|nr:BEM4 (YPL161C) [Zygosaccharomyces parabailii]